MPRPLLVPNKWTSIWGRCLCQASRFSYDESILRARKTSFLTDGMSLLPRKRVYLRLSGPIGSTDPNPIGMTRMPSLSTCAFVGGGCPWACKVHIAGASGGKKPCFPGARICLLVRKPVALVMQPRIPPVQVPTPCAGLALPCRGKGGAPIPTQSQLHMKQQPARLDCRRGLSIPHPHGLAKGAHVLV